MHAIVEGTMLSVCKNCAGYGNVVPINKPKNKVEAMQQPVMPREVETIVQDYADRIRKARESRGLTQEKLATAVAEKESVIQKLESRQLKPQIKLAKKLEQFLHIRLITTYQEVPKKDLNLKNESLTIGDLVKIKHEK